MARGLKILTAIWFLAGSVAASAQLADPTRPPAVADPSAASAAGTPAPAASGLQSVILRKKGQPAALINGEIVELGAKVGESRLVKVSEDAVVLRGPSGDETLRLMPSAEKRAARPERGEGTR